MSVAGQGPRMSVAGQGPRIGAGARGPRYSNVQAPMPFQASPNPRMNEKLSEEPGQLNKRKCSCMYDVEFLNFDVNILSLECEIMIIICCTMHVPPLMHVR